MSFFPKTWNKMFIIEVGPGIPYPDEKQRWQKYGEPLSGLFNSYFLGDKLFQWFKDGSEGFLAGFNIACFKSRFKWKEPQNKQKDIELFASLFAPLNDFFVGFGSWATITGITNIEETLTSLTVEAVKAKFHGASSTFSSQLPVEFDEPDLNKQMDMINHNERYYIIYIGKQTGCKRFREITKEQATKIAGSN